MLFSSFTRRFVSVSATSLKRGMVVRSEADGYLEVLTYQHLKTSQGRTASIVNFLDLSTFKYCKLSVNTEHKFETVEARRVRALVQYFTETHLIVSDATTFAEIHVPLPLVHGAQSVLLPGVEITLHCDVHREDQVFRVGLSIEMVQALKQTERC
jgi:translation elongation factor P/translation initiation factor 5A